MAVPLPLQKKKVKYKVRGRFDPAGVQYSSAWLGLGAGVGLATTFTALRGGLPAIAGIGALGIGGALYATLVEPRRPVLERFTLHFPRLPQGLVGMRIGVLGDLHLGHPFAAENSRWAIAQMLREQPELILITGDFVSYDHAIPLLPDLFRSLKAPLGTFAVLGNHDYWEGVRAIRAALEPLGVRFLINTGERLARNGSDFYLAGIDDEWEGEANMQRALNERNGLFSILLAHAPDVADEAAHYGVDLQISGHTHGGHLRLPLIGAFALPFYGTRYPIGHLQVGPTQVYVSRGLGGFPLRLNCPPEATIITLSQ
jgi:uncharacterized protein